MGGMSHLVQRERAWAGCGPNQSPARCTHACPRLQSLVDVHVRELSCRQTDTQRRASNNNNKLDFCSTMPSLVVTSEALAVEHLVVIATQHSLCKIKSICTGTDGDSGGDLFYCSHTIRIYWGIRLARGKIKSKTISATTNIIRGCNKLSETAADSTR